MLVRSSSTLRSSDTARRREGARAWSKAQHRAPSRFRTATNIGDAVGPDWDLRLEIPEGWRGVDIGPARSSCSQRSSPRRALFLERTDGVFETTALRGNKAIAEAMARCPGRTVVGGGDSAAALAQLGLGDQIDHVSTGGGATLELLEFGDLPGLAALRSAPNAFI